MFQTVAKELSDAFVTDRRDDGKTFYKIKDGVPAWISSDEIDIDEWPVFKAHRAIDDRLPDDWIYEQCSSMADNIADCENADDARDDVGEWADSGVDVYNSDRTAWLASHLGNISLCDEAVNELGCDDCDILQRIAYGQYMALERIAHALIDAIEAEAEEREEAEAEAEADRLEAEGGA